MLANYVGRNNNWQYLPHKNIIKHCRQSQLKISCNSVPLIREHEIQQNVKSSRHFSSIHKNYLSNQAPRSRKIRKK